VKKALKGGILAAVLAAGTATFGANSSNSSAQVYRWVDDKGVIHYGDSVPPEFAQSERSLLNRQGVEVGHVEGRQNAAQLAEQTHAAEEARQRAQHDQFLLSTYTSTKDIAQLRDERLDQVDGQIKAATAYIESLGTRLERLQERAQRFKPYSGDASARPMPDDLTEDLVHTANETRTQHQALDNKRKEELVMRAQFEADIARYRELTSRQRPN